MTSSIGRRPSEKVVCVWRLPFRRGMWLPHRARRAAAQRGSETRRAEAAGTESQTMVMPREGQPPPLRAHGSCETKLPTGVEGEVHPERPYFVPPWVSP